MVGQIQDVSLASLVNRRKVEEDRLRKQEEEKPTEIFNRILKWLYKDPMQDIEITFLIENWDSYGAGVAQLCKQHGLVVVESVPNKHEVYLNISIPSGV